MVGYVIRIDHSFSHFSLGGILGVFTHRSRTKVSKRSRNSGSTTEWVAEWVAGGCWDDDFFKLWIGSFPKIPCV